jgi:hypothetical protein
MPRDGWTDNGFAMALRAVPSLWLLTAACVLAGHLAGGLWLQRRGDAVMRTPPREPAPR